MLDCTSISYLGTEILIIYCQVGGGEGVHLIKLLGGGMHYSNKIFHNVKK